MLFRSFVVRPGAGELSLTDAQSVSGVQGVTGHNYVRGLTATPSDLKLVEMPASGVELSGDVAPKAGVTDFFILLSILILQKTIEF